MTVKVANYFNSIDGTDSENAGFSAFTIAKDASHLNDKLLLSEIDHL